MTLISVLHFLFYFALNNNVGCKFTQPIIGIFTQPLNPKISGGFETYLAASYVKFLESAGARVVPIPFEVDNFTLEFIFNQLNGILIPGGSTNIIQNSRFLQSVAYMVQRAVKANQNGDFFPIMGICLGHEAIHYILSDFNKKLLIRTVNQTAKSTFLNVTNKSSHIFDLVDNELYESITKDNLIYFNHKWGVPPEVYQKSAKLNRLLKIISINNDVTGKRYIAAAEGRNYPYHPEKIRFEFKVRANRTKESVQFSQQHANLFVDWSRRNNHRFINSKLEQQVLISQFIPIKIQSKSFDQVYKFQLGSLQQLYLKFMNTFNIKKIIKQLNDVSTRLSF